MREITISRHHEESAAQRLMKIDGLFHRVAFEATGSDMSGRGFDPQVIQSLAQFSRLVRIAIVPCEFDPLKPHPGHLRQCGIEVFRAISANRIKLNGHRNGISCRPGPRLKISNDSGCQ